jgi:aryl-alcohol dehydrogenase-like predicted oxidoreductase
VQSEFSLFARDMLRNGEREAADELGIGVVAFSPLGRGVLTESIRSLDELAANDARRGLPRFQPDAFTANRRLVERVELIARERGASLAQVALAWVLANGVVPIPGTRHRRRLEENAAAADLVLDADDLRRLDEALPIDEIVGSRDGIDAPTGVDR